MRKKWNKKYFDTHKYALKVIQRQYGLKLKDIVINYYSSGKSRCNCCKITQKEFLCFDHINGGGKKDRKERGFGKDFCRSIIKDNFPKGLQILCHNCNMAKMAYGKCPHVNDSSWNDDIPLHNKENVFKYTIGDNSSCTNLTLGL